MANSLRLHAYVLLADPAWIEPSVLSYYDDVDRIVASYDEDGIGWAGLPLPIDECKRRLGAIDKDHKVVWLPGRFRTPEGVHYMETETRQRQAALDTASEGADAVLQLDTDEIVSDPETFVSRLEEAFSSGAAGLEYAMRFLYSRISDHWYLEYADRYSGRTREGFPGPVAVRAGQQLKFARQIEPPSARCSWRGSGRTITPIRKSQAIIHAAYIRSNGAMRWKSSTSGHALDFDWQRRLRLWHAANRNPGRGLVQSYAQQGVEHLRLGKVRLALDPAYIDSGVE